MIVAKKRSRTDLEILFSTDPVPRSVDMLAVSKVDLTWHLERALDDKADYPQRVALTSGGRRRFGSYKHVVIQENVRVPIYRTYRREEAQETWKQSLKTIKKLDELIQDIGATTVLFQTWGLKDAIETELPIIRESYKQYAASLTRRRRVTYKPLIAPLGYAYLLVKQQRPELYEDLWESDEIHASEIARYFGALVFYETISGKSCVGKQGPQDIKLSKDVIEFLQDTAHKAVEDTEKD